MSQGLNQLSALLGEVVPGGRTASKPRGYRYDGREADDPYRLPSHMNRTGRKGKYGWECEGCGTSSTSTFTGLRKLADDAKRHDRTECI